MHTDAGWQRDLVDALRSEAAFNASGLAFPNVDWAAALEPTPADSAHAVASIRAWRSYLPEACVKAMISDGWQWST
jgi:hypothetical protein